MSLVLDLEAERGFDQLAVEDAEGRDRDTVALEHLAGFEVVRVDRDARQRVLLVGDADAAVLRERRVQVLHHRLGALRAVDQERPRPVRIRHAEPARQVQIGQAVDVVRVHVGDEVRIDAAERNAGTKQRDRVAASHVEQKLQPARLDQRAGAVAVRRRARRTGAKQDHVKEVLGHRRGRHEYGKADEQRKSARKRHH